MTSKQLVKQTMQGDSMRRTPIYGWVSENLSDEISAAFGSVEQFEDSYAFDMAHIFGGPNPFSNQLYDLINCSEEITPEVFLSFPLNDLNSTDDYNDVVAAVKHHSQRDRFNYVQTNGVFEALNGVFGIENHLMYLALYPDKIKEVYQRLVEWNIKHAHNLIELGVDGIHVSDDWGSQNSLMFSENMFKELIFPFHVQMVQEYKKYNVLTSLHSDGCITPALDYITEIGYDFIHPWQENANMPYSLYLEKYADKFGILGGVCVQSTLGFGNLTRLESEVRRVFSLLKGKRWACCTTHFVQNHCSIEELTFAFDLIRKLADD